MLRLPRSLTFMLCVLLILLYTSEAGSQIITAEVPGPNKPISTTIDQIITPSDKCQEIVGRFASAISNFTLCSVTNARPIHLCQWCVVNYQTVIETHHDFFVTIDEKGNPCREYFTNLDRIEIVSEAYMYVMNLWKKGKCDYCFQRADNGSMIPRATDDVDKFDLFYQMTKSCFDRHIQSNISNNTCIECKEEYGKLNHFYIDIGVKYGENVCLDIVDTMNTTRELWSQVFNCVPERRVEIWLHLGMAIVGVIPFIFYFSTYVLSTKQESRVVHQNRLAEVFAVTSNSGATDVTGFLSSRIGRSGSTSASRRSESITIANIVQPTHSNSSDD